MYTVNATYYKSFIMLWKKQYKYIKVIYMNTPGINNIVFYNHFVYKALQEGIANITNCFPQWSIGR